MLSLLRINGPDPGTNLDIAEDTVSFIVTIP